MGWVLRDSIPLVFYIVITQYWNFTIVKVNMLKKYAEEFTTLFKVFDVLEEVMELNFYLELLVMFII